MALLEQMGLESILIGRVPFASLVGTGWVDTFLCAWLEKFNKGLGV